MSDQQVLDIARRMEEAFVASDWDAYTAVLADDATMQAPTARLQGKHEVLTFAQSLKEGFPDLKATITNSLVSGNTAVLEIAYELTHSRELRTPQGVMPPTHRRAEFNAVKLVEVKDGKVTASRQYFDLGSVMAQLGDSAAARS